MAKRDRVLERILIGPALERSEGEEYLEIALRYDIGGLNYFSGDRGRRGYFVSVTPITLGPTFRSFTLFSGIKALVLEAKAYSEKKLDALTVEPALVARLKRKVLSDLLAKGRESKASTPEREARLARLATLLAEIPEVPVSA